jgi:uncharacterized membrane protein YqjE
LGVRALWSLPKAAPALLRHIVAYAELAALDIGRTQKEISSIFVAAAVAAVCLLFCLLLGCFAVIAYFWDSVYRVAAIGWLAGGFLLIAVVMLFYSARLSRARTPFLSDLQREWHEDRVILERILSDDEE